MMATHSSAGEAEEEDEREEGGGITPVAAATAPAVLKNLSSHMETMDISAITSSSSSSHSFWLWVECFVLYCMHFN